MLIGHVRYLALAVPQRGAATYWSLESTLKQLDLRIFFLRAVTVVIILQLYLTVYTLQIAVLEICLYAWATRSSLAVFWSWIDS